MSLNRFAFLLLALVYLLLSRPANLRACLFYAPACLAVSLALFVWIRRRPLHSPVRAMLALAGDLVFISGEMHSGDGAGCAFYPLYLWVVLGNGFRFGLRFLVLAMSGALAGFGLVCLSTPFWLREPAMSWSMLGGLAIVPGYAGALISKLSAARREAEAASHAKSMFLASVSHSVRTPLNAILGSIGLLRTTRLDDEQQELLDRLRTGSDMLMSLVSGILDFTQLEADRKPVRLASIDIVSFLLDLRNLLSAQARAKNIRLFVHVGGDIPDSIVSDPAHIHEILINLVSNALKFTSSGSVVLGVAAEAADGNRVRLTLSVSDTGIGIQPEALGHIFQSFTQADGSIIDRFGGTGLGLAIVERLVLLLGGRIAVRSTPGHGSLFQVMLDCARGEPAATHDSRRPQALVVYSTDENGDVAARILAARPAARIVRSAGQLAALAPAEADTVLVLDCPDAAARAQLAPMLLALDPWGDLPRILVPGPLDAAEAETLDNHVTAYLETGFDAARLECALASCRPRAPAVPGTDPEVTTGHPPLSLLVADDNAINRKLVRTILEQAGHRVHVVADGEAALVALSERRFDLALLDLNMPNMSGLEAAREYRFLSLGQPAVPLVALTADATPDTALRCREAGMMDCITKPVTPPELVGRVHALMRSLARPDQPAVTDIRSHPQFRPARQVLDPAVLAELRLLGGSRFTTELIEQFVAEATDTARRLEQAASAGNGARFRNEAHAIRSVAANIGALAVRELCGQCRLLANGALPVGGVALARQIQAAIAQVTAAIPRNEPEQPPGADPVRATSRD